MFLFPESDLIKKLTVSSCSVSKHWLMDKKTPTFNIQITTLQSCLQDNMKELNFFFQLLVSRQVASDHHQVEPTQFILRFAKNYQWA